MLGMCIAGSSCGQGRGSSISEALAALFSRGADEVATRCCQAQLLTELRRAVAESQLLSPDLVAESGQAGLETRRRPGQELRRKAAANINSVSSDVAGRVAGVGSGLSWIWSSVPVLGAGSSRRRWEIK
jgi:hypothetical protein